MRSIFLTTGVVAAGSMALWLAGRPAASVEELSPTVTARLVANVESIKPGEPFEIGVLFTITDKWHIYWHNPGDSGMATSVAWALPPGYVVGPLRWPRPETFRQPGDIVGYGYTNSVMLWATVLPPKELHDKSLTVTAATNWLACAAQCVPGSAQTGLTLPIAAEAKPANVHLFADWMGRTDPLASPLSLSDQNGKTVSLSDYAGKTVVLEWLNPDCPFSIYHHTPPHDTMVSLYDHYKDRGVVWLGINSTHTATVEKNKAFHDQHLVDYPVLDDHLGTVGKAYGAKATPHMFVIAPDGTVAYRGAIDDAPLGKGPGNNFVAKALDDVLAGRPVETPVTAAYGCSVKYAE